jgi:hypothetical protein
MSDRATQLHTTAEQQIADLTALIGTLSPDRAHLPCPGREKLGDGSVGAIVQHTAGNYARIAEFVQTGANMTRDRSEPHGEHRIPSLLRRLGHSPGPGNGGHDKHDANMHASETAVETHETITADTLNTNSVLEQLAVARGTLGTLGELTDTQLDTIPPDGVFRFCDGNRTLEQVLDGLLKQQAHQLEALQSATT